MQPRYDINAPDLYLPTMGYITYVIVAGLLLGMQNRFSPEQLGIQASSAMAYSIFELVIYSISLYVMNVKTSLKTLDLLAFTGYKYVNIVVCLLMSTLFFRSGYYIALAYTSFSFGFFLVSNTNNTKRILEVINCNCLTATDVANKTVAGQHANCAQRCHQLRSVWQSTAVRL